MEINKCIECNYELGYYPIRFENKMDAYEQCYNQTTKLNNFYLDLKSKSFNLCYELCNTCENGGNYFEHNCTSCIFGYKLESNTVKPSNCILDCAYYYYYTIFGQYRCTTNWQCPLENNLLIRPNRRCVNNCNNDKLYKFQYNSECLEKCPNNTIPNNINICEENNKNICSLSIFDLNLNLEDIKSNNIEISAFNYAKEFIYTNNHISKFNNELYSYILFKNSNCIDELSLNFSNIDFGTCYNKVQSYYNITNELIISILNIKINENKPVTIYEMYEPKKGEKIDVENICENQTIIISENILEYINKKFSKYLLSEEKIDIFNLSGPFYSDIYYHFESLNNRDIPLRDRILSFYPNISVCDNGCTYKRINLETLKADCECIINNFIDNYLSVNNFPITNILLNDTLNLIRESNILVLKCYKDLFYFKYYKNNKGSYIFFAFISIQILCTIIFLYKDLFNIKKYIYNLTENFIKYFHLIKDNLNFFPPIKSKRTTKTISQTKRKINVFTLGENDFYENKTKYNLNNNSEKNNIEINKKHTFNKNNLSNSRGFMIKKRKVSDMKIKKYENLNKFKKKNIDIIK